MQLFIRNLFNILYCIILYIRLILAAADVAGLEIFQDPRHRLDDLGTGLPPLRTFSVDAQCLSCPMHRQSTDHPRVFECSTKSLRFLYIILFNHYNRIVNCDVLMMYYGNKVLIVFYSQFTNVLVQVSLV